MEQWKLCESDYRFMTVVWDHQPLSSGELVALCSDILGWKKPTTYTVLRKVCEKGLARNQNSTVTALVAREQVQAEESERFVERTFGGSLPGFLVSFLGERRLSDREAEELKRLIDEHKEG